MKLLLAELFSGSSPNIKSTLTNPFLYIDACCLTSLDTVVGSLTDRLEGHFLAQGRL